MAILNSGTQDLPSWLAPRIPFRLVASPKVQITEIDGFPQFVCHRTLLYWLA